MMTFDALADRFPSRRALAAQIGAKRDLVDKWCERGRSPGDWDVALMEAAEAFGVALTFEELARCRDRRGAAASGEEAAG